MRRLHARRSLALLTAVVAAALAASLAGAALNAFNGSSLDNNVPADGVTAATVRIYLIGDSGGSTVVFSSTLGSVSGTTYLGQGTYEATVRSTKGGTATVTATVNGAPWPETSIIHFRALSPTAANSTISLGPPVASSSGGAYVVVTVQLRDQHGNPLDVSRRSFDNSVDVATNFGEIMQGGGPCVTEPITDGTVGPLCFARNNYDGTFTATLYLYQHGTATVSGTLDGVPLGSTQSMTW
jgi:adhesin/invasin